MAARRPADAPSAEPPVDSGVVGLHDAPSNLSLDVHWDLTAKTGGTVYDVRGRARFVVDDVLASKTPVTVDSFFDITYRIGQKGSDCGGSDRVPSSAELMFDLGGTAPRVAARAAGSFAATLVPPGPCGTLTVALAGSWTNAGTYAEGTDASGAKTVDAASDADHALAVEISDGGVVLLDVSTAPGFGVAAFGPATAPKDSHRASADLRLDTASPAGIAPSAEVDSRFMAHLEIVSADPTVDQRIALKSQERARLEGEAFGDGPSPDWAFAVDRKGKVQMEAETDLATVQIAGHLDGDWTGTLPPAGGSIGGKATVAVHLVGVGLEWRWKHVGIFGEVIVVPFFREFYMPVEGRVGIAAHF